MAHSLSLRGFSFLLTSAFALAAPTLAHSRGAAFVPLVLPRTPVAKASHGGFTPVQLDTDKPQRVELKPTVVQGGKPIPDHALPEKEADALDWPDASFTLFYKKGFATFGLVGEEEHTIERAWYKPLPGLDWMLLPDSFLKTLHFDLAYMGGEDDAAKGIVAGYAFMDVPPGMWKFDVDITVHFVPTSENMDEEWKEMEGHARLTIEASTPQRDDVGNPVELHPKWISGMEWASTMTGPWQKVPKPGEAGFPLHVKQPLNIYLRAVKQYPKEPWPTEGFTNMDIGERLPKWEARYMGTRAEEPGQPQLSDDVFWVNKDALFWETIERVQKGDGLIASSADNLLKITANAGENETAQLFVDPLAVPAAK